MSSNSLFLLYTIFLQFFIVICYGYSIPQNTQPLVDPVIVNDVVFHKLGTYSEFLAPQIILIEFEKKNSSLLFLQEASQMMVQNIKNHISSLDILVLLGQKQDHFVIRTA